MSAKIETPEEMAERYTRGCPLDAAGSIVAGACVKHAIRARDAQIAAALEAEAKQFDRDEESAKEGEKHAVAQEHMGHASMAQGEKKAWRKAASSLRAFAARLTGAT